MNEQKLYIQDDEFGGIMLVWSRDVKKECGSDVLLQGCEDKVDWLIGRNECCHTCISVT